MPDPPERRSPAALVVSTAFGTTGLVLLLIGLVTDVTGLVVGGVAAGTVSLVAALVWREQLIKAWRGPMERGQEDQPR